MKIGIVLPEAPQYSETFFNYKIKGLQESGYEVTIFSNKRVKGKTYFKNVNAYPVYNRKAFKQFLMLVFVSTITFLRNPSKVILLFQLERRDGKSFSESFKSIYLNAHILPHNLNWLHFGFTTMTMKRENVAEALGARMSISFRGYDINIYPLKYPDCYKNIWKKVNKVHTISDYLYEKALGLGLSRDTPNQKITPAIDLTLFKIRNDLGEIKNPLRILTVGRLNWIKDYETAISSMKMLKDKGINFVYNIVGTGKEYERLKFATYQSGLLDNIFFLGKIKHSEINELMHNSDIYMQTSMQEGFCVSVLEAQATGLLCIVSDADGLKENVLDDITGWIVQRRNPDAFADKILEVINMTPKRRIEAALKARKRVEENFEIKDQKIKFTEFFLK